LKDQIMPNENSDPRRDEQAAHAPRARLPIGEILTPAVCRLSGRAARILRFSKDRASPEDLELLDVMMRPSADLFLVNPDDELARIERELGVPELDPSSVDRFSLELLGAEYRELAWRIGAALSAAGLQLVDDFDDGPRLRIEEQELASVWFDCLLSEAIDNGEGEEDASPEEGDDWRGASS
jgi:hypothetical protein